LDTTYFPSKVRATDDRVRKLQKLSELLCEVAPFPDAAFLADASGLIAQQSNYVLYMGQRTATFAPAWMGNIGEKKRLYVAWIVARLLWPNKNAYAAVREQLGKKETRTEKAIYQNVTRFEKRSRTLESYSRTSQPLMMAVEALYSEFLWKERLEGKRIPGVRHSEVRRKLLALARDRTSTKEIRRELLNQQISQVQDALRDALSEKLSSLPAQSENLQESLYRTAREMVIAMWSEVRQRFLQLSEAVLSTAAVPGFDGEVRVGYHIKPELQFVAQKPHEVKQGATKRRVTVPFYLAPKISIVIEWIQHSGTFVRGTVFPPSRYEEPYIRT
jgi:hypothetical protein